MKVTIEETLAGGDVDTALTTAPYMIYAEVLEGARRPLALLQVVGENFDLVGATGHTVKILKATQLSATEASEATILGDTGMSSGDKTMSAVTIEVPNVIYSAVQLSDMLAEEYPKIDWLRLHLRNMGKAVMEYLEKLVKDALVAATVDKVAGSDSGKICYSDIVKALAVKKNADWIPDPANPPFLVVSPDIAANLLKDTTFVSTERYTTGDLSKMVAGEIGRYAGCRVLESSLLNEAGDTGTDLAFIIFPREANGPVIDIFWKRRLTVKNEYEAKHAYTYFVTSIRAKPAVIQAKGICKLTTTVSP